MISEQPRASNLAACLSYSSFAPPARFVEIRRDSSRNFVADEARKIRNRPPFNGVFESEAKSMATAEDAPLPRRNKF